MNWIITCCEPDGKIRFDLWPKTDTFWPNYWLLRCNGQTFVKFGLQTFWRLPINILKSDFISNSIWLPFWPNHWPLRSNDWNFMKFGLQMFWRLLINMMASDFITDSTSLPYWPNFMLWELTAGFSWNLMSGGYH